MLVTKVEVEKKIKLKMIRYEKKIDFINHATDLLTMKLLAKIYFDLLAH